ncbi:protein phosphatase 1 regulatory subunit 1B isoform X2 [Poecilia formosa]|uniref:protein phosphatase 1 regulatory subunit 1B isoform X2 n=1 Tax=Poecilia formosa TaxID=48698 RepID=UPI0007B7F51C|nr:PREDICTED: protein phosphatase 1 regulatory subunit 1C isoform X2 [Poecilia formosa]
MPWLPFPSLQVCQLVIMDPIGRERPLLRSFYPSSLLHMTTLSLSLPIILSTSQSVIMEPGSPKKIQFAVPPLQGQIDPQAAEHIRRRRPTPATLQIYRQPGTDVGDQQNASGEPQASDAAQRKQSTYAPPSMKDLQLGVEQHLLGAGLCETDSQLSPITTQLYATGYTWANHNQPEEANGNEACLLLTNQERDVTESNSSGGKLFIRSKKEVYFFINCNVIDKFDWSDIVCMYFRQNYCLKNQP